MIFLSHTHADKPVVEPVALQLREIFGTQNEERFLLSGAVRRRCGQCTVFGPRR